MEKLKSMAAILISLLSVIGVMVIYLMVNSTIHNVNTKLEEKEKAINVRVDEIVKGNVKDRVIYAKRDSAITKSIDSLHHATKDLQIKINKNRGTVDDLYNKDKTTYLNLPKPD